MSSSKIYCVTTYDITGAKISYIDILALDFEDAFKKALPKVDGKAVKSASIYRADEIIG